jgi:hypothetical protein
LIGRSRRHTVFETIAARNANGAVDRELLHVDSGPIRAKQVSREPERGCR